MVQYWIVSPTIPMVPPCGMGEGSGIDGGNIISNDNSNII